MNDPGASQSGGQSSGPQQTSGSKGSAQNGSGLATQLDVQSGQLSVQTMPGGSLADIGPGQNSAGLGSDLQGDKEQGQDGTGSETGQGSLQGDNQGNNENPADQPNGQGDNSGNGVPPDNADSGSSPTDGYSGTQDDPNNLPNGADGQAYGDGSSPDGFDPGAGTTDASNGTPDGGNGQTDNTSPANQDDNPADTLQGGTSAAIPSSKSNNDSGSVLSNSQNNTAGMVAGDPTNGTANGTAPEKKQHNQSSGSMSEGEQHSPGNSPDSKQHSADGIFTSGEELHSQLSPGVQIVEQNTRFPAGMQSQQPSGPLEDPTPRQLEDRASSGEAFQKSAIAEVLSNPAMEVLTSFRYEVSEDLIRDNDRPNGSPQNHGLITNSLSLDFSSLGAEVQSFFDQIDDLGGHPTERQLGMILSSGAVMVATAMACEVARRQARRSASGANFALVSKLQLRSAEDAPSGIGLPNFGQFSACS